MVKCKDSKRAVGAPNYIHCQCWIEKSSARKLALVQDVYISLLMTMSKKRTPNPNMGGEPIRTWQVTKIWSSVSQSQPKEGKHSLLPIDGWRQKPPQLCHYGRKTLKMEICQMLTPQKDFTDQTGTYFREALLFFGLPDGTTLTIYTTD